jgi:hypothetical protein
VHFLQNFFHKRAKILRMLPVSAENYDIRGENSEIFAPQPKITLQYNYMVAAPNIAVPG